MRSIGLYSATDQEVAAIRRAADRVTGVDLSVRSGSDVGSPGAADALLEELLERDIVVFWLHGAERRLPNFDRVVDSVIDAGIPLVIASSGESPAVSDSTVSDAVRTQVEAYLDRGGALNIANMARFLATTFGDKTLQYDDPVTLPGTGVYHPDHPAATYEELRATFESDRPTVGIWFYESHWTHENTRYVDALVRAFEEQGADALPVFTQPVRDGPDERDARWVAENWFTEDGATIVDAVCSSFMFSLSMEERGRTGDREGTGVESIFLEELGVPVLQTMTTMQSEAEYQASDTGLQGFEIALSVALPEFDGTIITHPISAKERVAGDGSLGTQPKLHLPIQDRIEHVTATVVNWARLRRRPNSDTRIAVVLHNYPPSDDGIGTAFGLDTPASLDRLLDHLESRGYRVGERPADGQALVESIAQQLTLDGRWVDPDRIRETSVDTIPPETYQRWYRDIDDSLASAILEAWGDPPETRIAIPGNRYGNVLVTVQPPRGFEADPSKVYHDSNLYPPHEYVAFYAWLQESFDAHAVVHLGTHGSLEWLPGKTVGLDASSAADQLVDSIPNVYPYVINNPGEGAQAKRRSYAAIVDHLTPPMRAAGTYDDLADLEELVREYREAAREDGGSNRRAHLEAAIRETVAENDLGGDIGVESAETVDIDQLASSLHGYLTDVRSTQIRMGLHTLGSPPDGEALIDYLVALTRFENPGAPSLRESVARALGIPFDRMVDQPEAYDESLGMYYSEAAERVYETSVELVSRLAEEGFDPDNAVLERLGNEIEPLGDRTSDEEARADLEAVLRYLCAEVLPRVRGASQEIERTAEALAGQYVPPGGSGAPTRGGVDLLPTGRNFYTLDPRKVPGTAAWEVGREIAAGVLERHREEEGSYPEEVGVVAWGTPTVRTRGETIAQILALLGVEPVWTDTGRVEAVEPVPLEELGRPRIDVTTRVSGLFRDAFPQVAGIIHEAVETVAGLDEPPDRNYVRKHVLTEAEDVAAGGIGDGTPNDPPIHRVFTTRPGGYGSGTNKAITTGNWSDDADLADVYVNWGGYAMDRDGEVTAAHEAFDRRLETMEATVKLEDTAEQDEFDSSDWYAFHGGLQRAIADRRGEEPAAYVGDAADPDRPTIYTNEEKLRKTMRTRVLNPDWLDSMEAHDYKGAGDLATTVEIALGWDVTTAAVSDTLWDDIADAYVFDEDRQDWIREVNPWALESIAETLLEAIERDCWDADQRTIDRLRDLRLSVDGDLEAKASGLSEGPR